MPLTLDSAIDRPLVLAAERSERYVMLTVSAPDGKGRAFVEDEPASVRTLAKLGERLIAIHGQNSERELTDREAPLELLDVFAVAGRERDTTGEAAAGWRQARRALEALQTSRRDREARLDLLDYQIREIAEAAPAALNGPERPEPPDKDDRHGPPAPAGRDCPEDD